jgi:GGDEF domain-containing protein
VEYREQLVQKIEKALLSENITNVDRPLTVSIGYSLYSEEVKSLENAILMADKKLYESKLEKKRNILNVI